MSTKSIERTKDLLDQLKEHINEVKSSDEFKQVLAAMARFHNYSWRNSLLIFMQKPTATRVAGYGTWKKMGRKVKKGEKAIWIFAPMKYKRKDRDDSDDNDDEAQLVTYFKPVPVFNVSQTEGEPLPALTTTPIANTHDELLDKLVELSGKMTIEIKFEDLRGMDGLSRIGGITINTKRNPTEQAVILLHELAHEMIHDSMEKRSQLTTEQKEMEAEAVAWVVSQQLELPETNSKEYLALYHKSYDLQESLQVIHKTAQGILGSLNHSEKPQLAANY